MEFKDLKLSSEMLETLEKINYKEPSEIQAATIPLALEGKDIIGQAQTGTGKTASFAIPTIEKTIPGQGIQHIILAPSRELAKQIQDEYITLSKNKKIYVTNIIGGVSYDIQRRDIAKNPEILIATPGRLIDHLESKRINIDLKNVKTFILDEADEMLNFGFYKEMIKIAEYLPKKKQTLFFTATFNKKTKELAKQLLDNPEIITISSGLSTNDRVEQKYLILKEKEKLFALYNLLQIYKPKSVILFGRTKRRVDELSDALIKLNIKALGIQGDMRQSQRSAAIRSFREGNIQVLIGTDVLARGIDVEGVDLVINFDLPLETEYYTHRIGRTGRANNKGVAISLVKDSEDKAFQEMLIATSSKAKLIHMPTEEDIILAKEEHLESMLLKMAKQEKTKYTNIAKKIMDSHHAEEIALMLASVLINESMDPGNISLTSEQGIDSQKKSGRSRGNNRNRRSRGNNRGSRDNNGRSSRGNHDRGGNGYSRSSNNGRNSNNRRDRK